MRKGKPGFRVIILFLLAAVMTVFIPVISLAQTVTVKYAQYDQMAARDDVRFVLRAENAVRESESGDLHVRFDRYNGTTQAKMVIAYAGKLTFGTSAATASSKASLGTTTVNGEATVRFKNGIIRSDGTYGDVLVTIGDVKIYADPFSTDNSELTVNKNYAVNLIYMNNGGTTIGACDPVAYSNTQEVPVLSGTNANRLKTTVAYNAKVTVKLVKSGTTTEIPESAILHKTLDLDRGDYTWRSGAHNTSPEYVFQNGSYSEGIETSQGFGRVFLANKYQASANNTTTGNADFNILSAKTVSGNTRFYAGQEESLARYRILQSIGSDQDIGRSSLYDGTLAEVDPTFSFYITSSKSGTGAGGYQILGGQPLVYIRMLGKDEGESTYHYTGYHGKIRKGTNGVAAGTATYSYVLNSSTTYTYQPDPGYHVAGLVVGGEEKEYEKAGGIYTFDRIFQNPLDANNLKASNPILFQVTFAPDEASVLASYVDVSGEQIAEGEKQYGVTGQAYDTVPKVIPGYILCAVPDQASGSMLGDIEVKYVYRSTGVTSLPDLAEGTVYGGNVTVEDALEKIYYKAVKTDQNGNPVSGAQFQVKALTDIYDTNGDQIAKSGDILAEATSSVISVEGGTKTAVADFQTAFPTYRFADQDQYKANGGWMYEITETKAPDGYEKSEEAVLMSGDPQKDDTSGTYDGKTVMEAVAEFSVQNVLNDWIRIRKVWNGYPAEGVRPEKIYVDVYSGNEKVKENVELSEDNGWKAELKDLPRLRNGEPAEYHFVEKTAMQGEQESVPAGYTVSYSYDEDTGTGTITNTGQVQRVSVIKQWKDTGPNGMENEDGIRPDEIRVELIQIDEEGNEQVWSQDGEKSYRLNDANGWELSFDRLPTEQDGKLVHYEFREVMTDLINGNEVTGYAVHQTTGDTGQTQLTTLTNVHKPQKTKAEIEKHWDDKGSGVPVPDELTVTLLQNGVPYSGEYEAADGSIKTGPNPVKVTGDGNVWHAEVKGLPRFAGGKPAEYTFEEVADQPALSEDVISEDGTRGKWVGEDPVTAGHITQITNVFEPDTGKDLSLQKKVTGNMGSKKRRFGFKVTVTGLLANKEYQSILTRKEGGEEAQTYAADHNGTLAVSVRLSDGDQWKLQNIPAGSRYSVEESKLDTQAYETSWLLSSEDLYGNKVKEPVKNVEDIEVSDKTAKQAVLCTNHRDVLLPTGLSTGRIWAFFALIAAVFMAVMLYKRHIFRF